MTPDLVTVDRRLLAPGADPAVPRPPCRIEVDVPEPWFVLDLDPRTSARWVRQLVQQRAWAGRASAVDQQAASRVLRGVVDALRAQGVLLAAILAGNIGHEVIGASVTLGWRRTSGCWDLHAVGLALSGRTSATDGLIEHREVDLVELPRGRAVHLRGRERARVPGSTLQREVALHQLFVPLEGSGWLAVVTATTALLRLSEVMGETALRVAASIRVGDAMG
jgi:hypothetical protein